MEKIKNVFKEGSQYKVFLLSLLAMGLSTGLSVNHMITILIALFGGWIWQTVGMETLFIISAVLGLCNSAYAATIKVEKKAV